MKIMAFYYDVNFFYKGLLFRFEIVYRFVFIFHQAITFNTDNTISIIITSLHLFNHTELNYYVCDLKLWLMNFFTIISPFMQK